MVCGRKLWENVYAWDEPDIFLGRREMGTWNMANVILEYSRGDFPDYQRVGVFRLLRKCDYPNAFIKIVLLEWAYSGNLYLYEELRILFSRLWKLRTKQITNVRNNFIWRGLFVEFIDEFNLTQLLNVMRMTYFELWQKGRGSGECC